MAKSGKRSGKGKSTGDGGGAVPSGSKSGGRKLRRLERELAAAQSLESKRARQLAEAQAEISSLTARIAASSDAPTPTETAAKPTRTAKTAPAAKPTRTAKTAPAVKPAPATKRSTTKRAATPKPVATTRPRRPRVTRKADTGPAGGSPATNG